MKKVWIVQDYNEMSICGVFTTKKKAFDWIRSPSGYPNTAKVMEKFGKETYAFKQQKGFVDPMCYVIRAEVR